MSQVGVIPFSSFYPFFFTFPGFPFTSISPSMSYCQIFWESTTFCYLFGLESDCILHGYIKKLGGPFASAWQTRYAKLYPNRLELHPESGSTKPELVFMDQIEDVSADLVHVKNEQCIVVRTRDAKIVLTNPVSIQQISWSLKFFQH